MQAIERQASAESAEVNQFATVLAFKQRSKGEARAALAALRSSDDNVSSAEVDALARKLQAEEVGGALRIGDCALRDPDSRVAVVTIDQMFHVLQRAAQTNPKLKAVDWAQPGARRPAGLGDQPGSTAAGAHERRSDRRHTTGPGTRHQEPHRRH